jgi:hypothetical protein
MITGAKIAPATITGDKIVPGTLTASLLAAGILTNGTRMGLAYAAIDGKPLTGGKLTAGTIPIGTVPGGSLVIGCVSFARTAFDGNAAITIGRSGQQTALIPTAVLAPINTITGDDPADCGIDLYVPGVQSGDPTYAVTTWAHPRHKWLANDTIYNAYLTNTTGTVGVLDVYIFYLRGVMSG